MTKENTRPNSCLNKVIKRFSNSFLASNEVPSICLAYVLEASMRNEATASLYKTRGISALLLTSEDGTFGKAGRWKSAWSKGFRYSDFAIWE